MVAAGAGEERFDGAEVEATGVLGGGEDAFETVAGLRGGEV